MKAFLITVLAIFFLLVFVGIVTSAEAGTKAEGHGKAGLNGHDLLAACSAAKAALADFEVDVDAYDTAMIECFGYTFGFLDANTYGANRRRANPAIWEAVTSSPDYACYELKGQPGWEEIFDVFIDYLQAHPDRLQEEAPGLMIEALVEAYPCG